MPYTQAAEGAALMTGTRAECISEDPAFARQHMVRATEAMAQVGYRFCAEPDFRAAVQCDFQLAKESS